MSTVYLPNLSDHNQPQPAPLRRFQSLRHWLSQLWFGAPDLTPQMRMEQRLVALRYIGITFLAPTLPFLQLSPGRLLAAYVVLVCYLTFNFGAQFLVRRHSPWLAHGYVISIGDGLVISSMVLIGGGFTSPFYMILFPFLVAAAMRFGYGPALLILVFSITLDGISAFSHAGIDGNLLFRSGYLTLTTLLSSYLWEQARSAEAALAQQLDRARALNESSRGLNTSLQLDTVARSVAGEARRLAHAEAAVLRLGPEFSNVIVYDDATSPEPGSTSRAALFESLLAQPGFDQITHDPCFGVIDSGCQYLVLPLQTRAGIAGHLLVMREVLAPAFDQAECDVLLSFTERAVLAIENASLYKTLGDRSQDLQRAYADLASAHQELLGVDEMKTSFIANVSHELRTPLTSIRSFSELLLSYDVDVETRQEFLGIINTESERLTRLINDVLDITKIEAGQVDWQIEKHDLGEMIQESARAFSSLVVDKGLKFSLALPPEDTLVWADRDRVLQVLANLLGNALKFTPSGEIKLIAELDIHGFANIHVRDTGIGIALEHHERVFEKFHQVGDTLTDKPTGTGLGLCICRDIIEHHHGQIWVTSELGQGSTFSFSLPVAPAIDPALTI